VWKATKEIGVGRARVSKQNRKTLLTGGESEVKPIEQFVVVCFYQPSGNNNRPGQYHINVGKRNPPENEIVHC